MPISEVFKFLKTFGHTSNLILRWKIENLSSKKLLLKFNNLSGVSETEFNFWIFFSLNRFLPGSISSSWRRSFVDKEKK